MDQRKERVSTRRRTSRSGRFGVEHTRSTEYLSSLQRSARFPSDTQKRSMRSMAETKFPHQTLAESPAMSKSYETSSRMGCQRTLVTLECQNLGRENLQKNWISPKNGWYYTFASFPRSSFREAYSLLDCGRMNGMKPQMTDTTR
jgi:L-fucose isomerase-like protein